MTVLNIQPNFSTPDDVYALLLSAHDGLELAESHALNARLVLILMNHIGDSAVLHQAVAVARSPSSTAVIVGPHSLQGRP
jgi:Protein of unknown function (DUF2783)